MDSPYSRELRVAISAAQAATHISRLALSLLDHADEAGAGGSFGLTKNDRTPVTVADFAIQAVLALTLRHFFPDDAVVGEEAADHLRQDKPLLDCVLAVTAQCAADLSHASQCIFPRDAQHLCEAVDSCATGGHLQGTGVGGGKRTWVFDPIDGTKTFMRGEQYAINIALLQGATQVLSVVACPLLAMDAQYPVTDATVDPTGQGTILFAVRGHGAYVRPLPGTADGVQPQRLPRHADTASLDSLRSVTSVGSLDSGVEPIHQAVPSKLGVAFPGCNLVGWVLRWAVLALGHGNMTVWVYKKRDRYAKIWDHAGAMLLFEEVGGRITDVNGKDIDLSAGRLLSENFGFVAAPPNLHELVLTTLQDTLVAHGGP